MLAVRRHVMARLGIVSAALGLVVAVLSVPASRALAVDAFHDRIVTDNPADNTPDVVSTGSVRYLAQAGNTMVAGGNFTQVRNHGSSNVVTRNNLFSFNVSTGAIDPK